ncbi:hypothetical protein [Blastococcus deserti]|uniref:Uncharacterized protein n=1 Tax=Blastococcus deserti TaxID=2259033 RepID=A0ABW4X887_9ACTN
MREAHTVLWWLPAGVRLTALRHHGPTPYAFTVRRAFPAPGDVVGRPSDDDWFCRAGPPSRQRRKAPSRLGRGPFVCRRSVTPPPGGG